MGILNTLFPYTVTRLPELWQCTLQTLQMVFISGCTSFILGMFLGIVLTVTRKNGIMQCVPLYSLLDKVINILRSIPFIILLAALLPFTRAIVGTAIGVRGAIIPLVFGTVPFFARQIESALAGLDPGLIEAAKSMGDSPMGIIFRVYLRESIPAIARVTTITFVSLVGLTAIAGSVGAGGLGNFAIYYGHGRSKTDTIYAAMIIILAIVFAAQAIGNYIVKKTTH